MATNNSINSGNPVEIAKGGTGVASITVHKLVVGDGTSAINEIAVGTNGQVLCGSTAADPVFATITDGTGITSTLGAGTLAIESTKTTLNVQTGTSYTTVLTDRGKCITMSNAAASTLTIPLNASVAYPLGTVITVQQLGAGQVTLTPTAGVTFQSADNAYKLVKQYSIACLIKVAMDDTWSIGGDVSPEIVKNETGTTYTLVLTDTGKMITCTNASDITVTVPTNASVAFPIGTIISFFQGAAGQIILSGAVPPTLKSADDAYTTVKLYSGCCIVKLAEDVWGVFGDVEA